MIKQSQHRQTDSAGKRRDKLVSDGHHSRPDFICLRSNDANRQCSIQEDQIKLSYLLKVIWKQVDMRGFILGLDLSLQIAIMGTLVFLMRALRAPTPPRSPADIPSTSSIMMIDFLLIVGQATSSDVYRKRNKSISSIRPRANVARTPKSPLKKPSRVVLFMVSLNADYDHESESVVENATKRIKTYFEQFLTSSITSIQL